MASSSPMPVNPGLGWRNGISTRFLPAWLSSGAATGSINAKSLPPGSCFKDKQSNPRGYSYKIMNPKIRIFKDLEELSRAAAELFVEQAAQSIAARENFLVALNGGSTPNRLFQLLATEFREKVDWRDVHVFWGDERCVPSDDPGSSYGQARETLLRYVPIPDLNVHRVKGELGPDEASNEYSLTLKEFASPGLAWPRF